ncbi:hypothetical protein [Streptococcus suis]|uniref:Uncharacterized protein n=1 Tax=Streptococcus suis TaxID=1307 RepID=A0A9X4MWH2_STRSU|nr:hypothetical protein [Streptococcus suis]MDG4527299.1 hypothetical protein [Streptococcus suis]MDG4529731.1 hypothetical protein [Streptococcus suis]
MNIKQFINANIGRRLKKHITTNYKNNRALIADIDNSEYASWTEATLAKIINGTNPSISLTDLDTLAYIYQIDNYSEIVFGSDEDKLYLIRIILYSILGSGTLFSHKELEKLHKNQKFVKLPSVLLNYWTVTVPNNIEIQRISNTLTLLLCKNHDFLEVYFKKLFRMTSVLDNYHTLLIQQLFNEESIFSNTWLSVSESLDSDIEFYVAFYTAFNDFCLNNRKELLAYFEDTIISKFQEASNEGKIPPMLVLKDKLFVNHFSSQEFLTLLNTLLSDDDRENIRLRSLYQLEKQSRALHTSLYYDKFDYSVLDDVD